MDATMLRNLERSSTTGGGGAQAVRVMDRSHSNRSVIKR